MRLQILISVSALFLMSACASYEPAAMVLPEPEKASSREVVKEGYGVFAKALGTTAEQKAYFDADFNEAGIIAIQVMAENQSELPVLVRPSDMALSIPGGQTLSSVNSDTVAYSVGEDGSVVGATLAFGLIGWMAANEAEETSRNARLADYRSKSFAEQLLYQGQSQHGFVFFAPPRTTAPFNTAELMVTFIDDENTKTIDVRVPVRNIHYSVPQTQTASATASRGSSASAGTSAAGEQAAAFTTPDLPPVRSKEEVELFIEGNNEKLRRALFEYTRKHHLIPSGSRYGEFKLYSSRVIDAGGDQSVVRISYSSKTSYNANWRERQFLMQWVGDSLVFVGHA